MGRKDPTYSDEQRAELPKLVLTQAWSLKAATEHLGMPYETGRKILAEHVRDNPRELGDNPIGEMAGRLVDLVNRELSSLERAYQNVHNKSRLDVDRAGKLAKTLIDLDKLLKSNKAPAKPDAPASPLDALRNGKGAH